MIISEHRDVVYVTYREYTLAQKVAHTVVDLIWKKAQHLIGDCCIKQLELPTALISCSWFVKIIIHTKSAIFGAMCITL